jgi:hypothetical protein
MGKFFRVRKPRLRFTKNGVRLSGGGFSVGGKNARVNFSKSGTSFSGGVGKARYNSRRGWSMGCTLPIVLLLSVIAAFAGMIV